MGASGGDGRRELMRHSPVGYAAGMRWKQAAVVGLVVSGVVGCAAGGMMRPPDGGRARDAGRRDAGIERDAGMDDDAGIDRDAGAELDGGRAIDAGRDAGRALDGGRDAGRASDGGRDAGRDASMVRPPPTVDGTIGATEWAGATMGSTSVASSWTSNELRSLRVRVVGGAIYVAVEGTFETMLNGIVVYIDLDPSRAAGVADLATLTDASGALDNVVTPHPGTLVQPASFRADILWGTRDLSRSASGADDRMGWRDVARAAMPSDLYWFTEGAARSACSASACEATLPISALPVGALGARVAAFARIMSSDGSMSPNQTVPMDDPSMPRVVSAALDVPVE